MSISLPPFANRMEVQLRSARLRAVAGKKFFLLPVSDAREAAHWILASFFSPLTIVPYAASLPTPAVARLLAQLPSNETISLPELPENGTENELCFAKDPAATWAVIFSSGSSGDPKGVALSGAALQASAAAHAAHSGIRGGNWLLNLPLYHVGGFSVITRALFNGGDVRFAAPKFSAEETLREIRDEGITGLSLVPTALRRILTQAPGFTPPATLKMLLLGGAGAPTDLLAQCRDRGWPVFYTYGMTEHCSQIATESFPGSGLRPLPGVQLRITTGGEILVSSPCLAAGYYIAGDFIPLPRHQGFFATGDLGSLVDGALSILGRSSELIISGGVNIFPAEVENALARAPGVVDCGVVGLPDTEWGEVVYAAVVPDNLNASQQAIQDYLHTQLDGRKVPKRIVFVPAIPRSALGKITRPQLRALLEKKTY